jgi:hypothetical protein
MAFRPGGGSGWTHAYAYTNSQASQVYEGENFHSNLTMNLQLEWSFLSSKGTGQGRGVGCYKSDCMVLKVLKFP